MFFDDQDLLNLINIIFNKINVKTLILKISINKLYILNNNYIFVIHTIFFSHLKVIYKYYFCKIFSIISKKYI